MGDMRSTVWQQMARKCFLREARRRLIKFDRIPIPAKVNSYLSGDHRSVSTTSCLSSDLQVGRGKPGLWPHPWNKVLMLHPRCMTDATDSVCFLVAYLSELLQKRNLRTNVFFVSPTPAVCQCFWL